jgi:hypothetical protein
MIAWFGPEGARLLNAKVFRWILSPCDAMDWMPSLCHALTASSWIRLRSNRTLRAPSIRTLSIRLCDISLSSTAMSCGQATRGPPAKRTPKRPPIALQWEMRMFAVPHSKRMASPPRGLIVSPRKTMLLAGAEKTIPRTVTDSPGAASTVTGNSRTAVSRWGA